MWLWKCVLCIGFSKASQPHSTAKSVNLRSRLKWNWNFVTNFVTNSVCILRKSRYSWPNMHWLRKRPFFLSLLKMHFSFVNNSLAVASVSTKLVIYWARVIWATTTANSNSKQQIGIKPANLIIAHLKSIISKRCVMLNKWSIYWVQTKRFYFNCDCVKFNETSAHNGYSCDGVK